MSDKRIPISAKADRDIQSKTQHPSTKQEPSRQQNEKSRLAQARKRKRRFDPAEKLPTPPPDPNDDNAICERYPKRKSLEEDKENRVLNRDELPATSCSRRASNSSTQALTEAFSCTDLAFHHLDRLHALVSEILELRDKNSRLFRRVRELERMRASRRLESNTRRKFFRSSQELILPDEDIGFAESLLAAMLESSSATTISATVPTTPIQEMTRNRSFRAPIIRQRSRSIGTEANRPVLEAVNSGKRSSCHLQYGSYGKSEKRNSLTFSSFGMAPPKVSKWTKVKAAFKWERASMGTAGSSGALGNMAIEVAEQEPIRFLKLPEPAETLTAATTPSGSLPRTTDQSEPPSPGTLSSTSSIEDVCNGIHKKMDTARATAREIEDGTTQPNRSLDGEFIIPHNIQYATQHFRDGFGRRLEKGHRTPWGMMKDIIQSRRENVRRPMARDSLRSEDGHSLSSLESSDIIHDYQIFPAEHQSAAGARLRVQTTSSDSPAPAASAKPSSPAAEPSDLAARRLTPTLTITVPSSEELRAVSSPESASPPTSSRRQQQQLDSNSTDERSEDPETAAPPRSARSRAAGAIPGSRERRRSAAMGAERPLAAPRLQRQDSKWNKVKRAFLTGASSVPPSPSRLSSFFDETDAGGSCSASAEDLDNGGISPTVQADIQRNYQLLHDKLSLEFYRKLAEWEKLKSSGGGGAEHPSHQRSPKDRDSTGGLLLGEEQLTPEFKKKLQEWKRMKKGGAGYPSGTTSPEHPVIRRRLTDWQIWRTPTKTEGKAPEAGDPVGKAHLSEDFLKKMDEWKKIKSGRSDDYQSVSSRRDSAEMMYQTPTAGRSWKAFDEMEFQPLEKVIAMIEREQQRIERHQEKLIDKNTRISTNSGPLDTAAGKREVLVHTSKGFYRFEGISQEFTRKLYEWEKSQGIKPESSTLRLLNPAYRNAAADKTTQQTFEKLPRILKRSKSAISLLETNMRDGTFLRQSSSLSLNDITNIETQEKLRIDSKQTIGDEEMSEELALDDSEPEAVIVDIEDVIEETASPIARFQPEQTPVYCVTASETTSIAIPLGTVTSNHEPSPVILVQAEETHHRVQKHYYFSQLYDDNMQSEYSLELYPENTKYKQPMSFSDNSDISNDETRKRLFQPSDINICETIIEEDVSSSHIGEESSSDAEINNYIEFAKEVGELIEETKLNFQECAPVCPASSIRKVNVTETSHEQIKDDQLELALVKLSESERDDPEGSKTLHNRVNDLTEDGSSEDEKNGKAKIENCNLQIPPSEEEKEDTELGDVVITIKSNMRQKKILKTRRLTDTQVGYKWQQSSQQGDEISPESTDTLTVSAYPETPSVERIIINENTLNKIVVPTASNEQISNIVMPNDNENVCKKENNTDEKEYYCRRKLNYKADSENVFVKTKRIIFSPFSRRNGKDKSTSTSRKNEIETPEPIKEPSQFPVLPVPIISQVSSLTDKGQNSLDKNGLNCESPLIFEKRPPLPQSPILQRKEYRRSSPKETAPSIRIMIQRYNQKLQEDASSPASSGSGSPLWRSPISERRVRTQMERYQEEVRRAIAGTSLKSDLEKKRLEKSASTGIILPMPARNILKSTSADFVRNPEFVRRGLIDSKIEASDQVKNAEFSKRRKNSLQNKTPEIFSNIKQCLVQESKTISMKNENMDERNGNGFTNSDNFDRTLTSERAEKFGIQVSDIISPELISTLNSLSNLSTEKYDRYSSNMKNFEYQMTTSENSTPLRVRAQSIKKAKDDFFSRGPTCYSHEPSIESYLDNETSETNTNLGNKSVSVGMINVDTRTFERLATKEKSERNCGEVAGTLSKIASRFRRAKIKRNKDKEGKMSTVSTLCRQSLLVDIQAQEMSKSCPTSPSPHRDTDERSRLKQC